MRQLFSRLLFLVLSITIVGITHAADPKPISKPPHTNRLDQQFLPDPSKAATLQTDARDSKDRLQEKLNTMKKII